ncbi:MAG: phospholipase D family protein [Antarcticimicrobium sp.]|uniref:phospholipase D family protein n=1 Tax=Antarcticimicrobium sp. TaxID=2824147 RepID=UPI002615A8C3|nr:phospholipase D family protein [Antarcticimicrobium sp.]MDF1718119.1 phospholipase D family protein [Antarcticimicrobium sp.]
MATVRAIFQPLAGGQQHAPQLVSLAGEPWLDRLIISSAFSNSAGVAAVSAALAPVAGVCRAFIGVRNGSTTAQATAALLKLGVELYALDTATRGRIFHPKAFIATGPNQARAIVGSANLTHAGLFNNIEAGTDMDLDLADASDRAFVDTMLDGFDDLIVNHPQHCFRIGSGREIVDLMKQGILEDERNPKTQTTFGSGKQGNATSKPRINLPFKSSPAKTKAKKPKIVPAAPAGTLPVAPPIYGQLVWAKPSLPRSDLQLNPGHAPGVLRLTQAKYKVGGAVIDQTIYFRNQVFGALNWTYNTTAQKDEAVAPTSLVIAGVYVGDFDMPLSHKPAWAAGQGNYTTGLHWDKATSHIKQPGLVGRSLKLYQPASVGARYIVEID